MYEISSFISGALNQTYKQLYHNLISEFAIFLINPWPKSGVKLFAIPTAFNGNQLATMEAVYPDGSNAGPQDSTSFKEFGYTLIPSYVTKEIKLLPNFFKDVKDNKVTLKFHFWNGDVISYQITKNGTSAVGEAL